MKRNSGFSLVELMVAMVIGLIIILGAGQLFLTVFQTNRQVEMLSEKQAAVNFAVETLLRDIRRADQSVNLISWEKPVSWDREVLSLTVPNRGDIALPCAPGDPVKKVYRLSGEQVSDREGWALEMGQACSDDPINDNDYSQIVTSLEEDGFSVDGVDADAGVWLVTLTLMPTGQGGTEDQLIFHAVNRTAAVTSSGSN